MENGFLNLTWNNHGATYQQMLNNLRIENKLTDCTLACDGQKFSVHRLVLVTCSDFFKSLLEDVPCQHPIVYLRGVNGVEMQTLIEFMYLGKVDVPQKEVPNLLSTAETLKIKGLGVLHPEIKGDNSHNFPLKRKRSPIRKEVPYQTADKPSSPLVKTICKTSNSTDRIHSSKALKRDWSINDNLDKNIYNFSKLQTNSSNRQIGTENILTSAFKTSSTSKSSEVILGSIEENTGNYGNNLVDSADKNAPEECITLTQLMPLNTISKEQHKPINFTETADGHPLDVKVGGICYRNDDELTMPETFDSSNMNSTNIKEEALDYTRGPQLEIVENLPSPSQSCRSESDSNRATNLSTDDASHFFDHLAKNSSPHYTYPQDENVENGADSSRPFLCPICRKSFAKLAILKRHHLAHFRPYSCHICARSFTRREVLAEHVLEHNGADLRMPCPVCKMTIKRKRNLQAHIKVKHPEYHKQKSANNEALC